MILNVSIEGHNKRRKYAICRKKKLPIIIYMQELNLTKEKDNGKEVHVSFQKESQFASSSSLKMLREHLYIRKNQSCSFYQC